MDEYRRKFLLGLGSALVLPSAFAHAQDKQPGTISDAENNEIDTAIGIYETLEEKGGVAVWYRRFPAGPERYKFPNDEEIFGVAKCAENGQQALQHKFSEIQNKLAHAGQGEGSYSLVVYANIGGKVGSVDFVNGSRPDLIKNYIDTDMLSKAIEAYGVSSEGCAPREEKPRKKPPAIPRRGWDGPDIEYA